MASAIERLLVDLLDGFAPTVSFVMAEPGKVLPVPVSGVYQLVIHLNEQPQIELLRPQPAGLNNYSH